MNAEARRLRPGRLLFEWLVVGVLLSMLVIGLVLSGAVRRLDNIAYDYIVTRQPAPPPSDVIIIAIDEASLAQLGPWPWPRDIHAAAIDRLTAAKARAIAYDVLFIEPGNGDAALSSALARSGRVTLPMQFRVPGQDGRSHDALLPAVTGARIGHSSVFPDSDGVVRSINLAIDGERRWPHVATEVASPQALPPFIARGPTAPLLRQGERLIGFRGGAGRLRRVSFAALLGGEVPRGLIAGRTVLVGATAPGLGDQFATPGAGPAGLMSGVELQANVIADLMAGKVLRRAPAGVSLLLALALLWAGMAGLLRLRPGGAVLLGAALTLFAAVLAAAILAYAGLWIGPAAAIIGLALSQPVWAWRRLAVVNLWMMDEIAELGQPGARLAGLRQTDPVTRSTQLLAAAIDRVEGLRELADAAIRGLPDATLLVDRGGSIVAANTAAEALFGTKPVLAAINAAFEATGLPDFGVATLADPTSPWRGEHRARDGSIRDIRFTPWRDADGAALGWIVRFADITALRRAEAAREEALQLLTHDMRAPQATILALLDRETSVDPALVARLRHLARRTIGLADGYLQLARADAGSYTMDEVDLAAIVTEAVDELWPQSQAKGIRLDARGLDDEALLTGNYQLLLRAAINLIGNAVKFSPSGSVVGVLLMPNDKGWRLDIVDQGPGIAADAQARLFGRFRTGPQAAEDGIGLGLAFVRSVATGHGGTVSCVSTLGAGATFSLWLPASVTDS